MAGWHEQHRSSIYAPDFSATFDESQFQPQTLANPSIWPVKRLYVRTDSLILGPVERQEGNFQVHKLIRNDWHARDWFRDAMAFGMSLTEYTYSSTTSPNGKPEYIHDPTENPRSTIFGAGTAVLQTMGQPPVWSFGSTPNLHLNSSGVPYWTGPRLHLADAGSVEQWSLPQDLGQDLENRLHSLAGIHRRLLSLSTWSDNIFPSINGSFRIEPSVFNREPDTIGPVFDPPIPQTADNGNNWPNWNQGTLLGSEDIMDYFLSYEGMGTAWSGDPCYKQYTDTTLYPASDTTNGNPRMVGAMESVKGIFNHMNTDDGPSQQGSPNDDGRWVYDHTFLMREMQGPPVDAGAFGSPASAAAAFPQWLAENGESWANSALSIHPVYNYFLDTDPDYESVIVDLAEPLIPNYYMVEDFFENPDGPAGWSFTAGGPAWSPYFSSIAANGGQSGFAPLRFGLADTEFVPAGASGPEGAEEMSLMLNLVAGIADHVPGPEVPFGNRQGFFQLYANTMRDAVNGNVEGFTGPDTLGTLNTRANTHFRDIAVLTGDLPFIQGPSRGINLVAENRGTPSNPNDDLFAIDAYPFYNIISIGPGMSDVGGMGTGLSVGDHFNMTGFDAAGATDGTPNSYAAVDQANSGRSVLESTKAEWLAMGNPVEDFDNFVNVLQLLMCYKLSSPRANEFRNLAGIPKFPNDHSWSAGLTAANPAGSVEDLTMTKAIVNHNQQGGDEGVFGLPSPTHHGTAAPVHDPADVSTSIPTLDIQRIIGWLGDGFPVNFQARGGIRKLYAEHPAPGFYVGSTEEILARGLLANYRFAAGNSMVLSEKNFVCLRDTNSWEAWPAGVAMMAGLIDSNWIPGDLASEIDPALIHVFLNQIALKTRGLGETWAQFPGWSERFMHVVEKRVILPGEARAPQSRAPVQVFYFGLEYDADEQAGGMNIEYIDTQIKYGVRYQYDLKEARLILGNLYRYDSISTFTNTGDPGQGRAIANALGFYKEEGTRLASLSIMAEKLLQGMPRTIAHGYNENSPQPGGAFGAPWANEDQDVHVSGLDEFGIDPNNDYYNFQPWPQGGMGMEDVPHLYGAYGTDAILGYYLYQLHDMTVAEITNVGREDTTGGQDRFVFNLGFQNLGMGDDRTLITFDVDWDLLQLQVVEGFGLGGNATGGVLPGPDPVFVPNDPDPMTDTGDDDTADGVKEEKEKRPMNEEDLLKKLEEDGNPYKHHDTIEQTAKELQGTASRLRGEDTGRDGVTAPGMVEEAINAEGGIDDIDNKPGGAGTGLGPGTLAQILDNPSGHEYGVLYGCDTLLESDPAGFVRAWAFDGANEWDIDYDPCHIYVHSNNPENQCGGLVYDPWVAGTLAVSAMEGYANGTGACSALADHMLNAIVGSGGTTCCFVGGTKVTMSDGSHKNIEDVEVGDFVKTEHGEQRVMVLKQPILGPRLLYSFNGGNHFVTCEHPLMTQDGWKALNPHQTLEFYGEDMYNMLVGALEVGDRIKTENGEFVEIKEIDSIESGFNRLLYDLTIEEEHNYYADGYLAHNSAC